MDTPDSDRLHTAGDVPPLTQLLGLEEGSAEYLYLEMAPILQRIAAFTFHVPDEDAATLVHDVFITYLANRRGVRSDPRAYLVGGIRNASRKYWRTRHSDRRVFTDDEVRAAEEARGVRTVDFSEGLSLNMVVAAVLARLGNRCKEALRRYYLEGEDTAEIAQALDTTPANVNYIMFNCRKHARQIYESITQVR
ncbi:MAG TPA: sigma-70 family RNA polymerase sigma factor [Thermoanaerobaculia bacterium]